MLLEIASDPAKAKWLATKTAKGRDVSSEARWASCALVIGTMAAESGWQEFVPVLARLAERTGASPGEKWSACRLLAQFENAAAAAGAVRRCLEDEDLNVVAYAALAAGRTGDRTLIPLLRKGLQNDYVVLQARAAVGLGMLGDLASAPAIRKMLRCTTDENLRDAAARSLGAMGDREGVAALDAALAAEPFPWIREEIRKSLEKLKGPEKERN